MENNCAVKDIDEMTREEMIDEVNGVQTLGIRNRVDAKQVDVPASAEHPEPSATAKPRPRLLKFKTDENGKMVEFPEPFDGKMFLGKASKTPFPKPGIRPSKKKETTCKLSPANMKILADRGKPQAALSEIAEEIVRILHVKRVDSKLYYYKDIMWKPLDSKNTLRKVAYDFIPVNRSLGDAQWGEIYKIIQSRIDKYPVLELNAPAIQNMVCFKNGIFNVLRNEMIPHSHKYPFDTCLDFEFHPEEKAYSKVFNEYLDTSSQHNECVKRRMLQLMGVCCSNLPPLKRIGLVMGEPNSGKSTYGNIIKTIVGLENTVSFSFDHLTRFSYHSFAGKLLGLSTDMSDKRISESSASWLKMLTGGDSVYADVKHGEGYSYVSRCVVILASNYYPMFSDEALEKRMLVIPLPKSMQDSEMNRNLLSDIKNDMQAVLRQIMDELREFILSGCEFEDIGELEFYRPSYYTDKDSQAGLFFKSRCYCEKGSMLSRADFYTAFCGYCVEKGMRPVSKEAFEKQIKPVVLEHGIKDDRNGGNGRRYKDLAVSDVDVIEDMQQWE